MSLLKFCYFLIPYDAQASSACSALIVMSVRIEVQCFVFETIFLMYMGELLFGIFHLFRSALKCLRWPTQFFF